MDFYEIYRLSWTRHVYSSIAQGEISNCVLIPSTAPICLQNLGFESYIEEAQTVLEEHKVEKKKRVKLGKKMSKCGIPPEELAAQQRALFQQVRDADIIRYCTYLYVAQDQVCCVMGGVISV